ncbi:MAG: ABC transporter ATP-binding protein [Treponema sp.]|jgi:oligopeptide/dipeptide ABC transporter ATP-binding protein|nr:ABC transporter ATP-binding protein [Treponema sp.]
MAVIRVSNLRKRFNLEAGFFARFGRFVYAVNGVSFSIDKNETYGLVGESGCGKTTTARLLVRMYECDGGDITFQDGIDVRRLKRGELKKYRERVKYIFQDPARSLNPRKSVYNVLVSGYRWATRGGHPWPGESKAREEAAAALEEVGLGAADLERRPAEFSGGQRQRISIARGLLLKPDLLICDEVVSALDVSIQGQILNLLLDIRSRRGLSFLFIAHDLKVACYFCDRIGVMYRGELMEEAPAAELYKNALHPYTKLLFSSAVGFITDRETPAAREKTAGPGLIPGEVKRAVSEISGCPFAERCPLAEEPCFREHPELRELGEGPETGGSHPHLVRCFKVLP